MSGTSPLVTVLTPCYNGEATIGRLIESVLAQTHSEIEFIIVDDGSTDASVDVIMQYERDLHTGLRGFKLIRQPNRGLGGAIDSGLKHVTGSYLAWPDADDYLEPESVKLRLAPFRSMPDVAVVTSDAYIRNAEDVGTIAGLISQYFADNDDPWQFDHLLRAESIFASGCHLACMRRFDETHPGRAIYPARRGQNWQMLLPLYYRYQRFYLDVPLYNYVVSAGSMSRTDSSIEDIRIRAGQHQEIIMNTLSTIEMDPTERALSERVASETHLRALLQAGLNYSDAPTVAGAIEGLEALGAARTGDRVRQVLSRLGVLRATSSLTNSSRRLVQKRGPKR